MTEKTQPIYDINKTYLENLEKGPFFNGTLPKRALPPKKEWTDFLGFKLASPLGVPAGPLLDSKWIKFAAEIGFDLVTYKTIRGHEHLSHPLPNMVPVRTEGQLDPEHLPKYVTATHTFDTLADDTLGITNSFGNPSRPPEFLRQDLANANASLKEGQEMIVSVFGSQRPQKTVADDFAETALFAKECGAKIIEANYSCPNLSAGEGSLYSCPQSVFEFSSNIVKTIKDTPLIIKVGIFKNKEQMRQTFIQAARAGVQAIAGINTISLKVYDEKGKPALGPNRETCGICGNPIRDAAIQFTREAREIIDQEKLGLQLLVTGGATQPQHFRLFLDAGADIAMSATGMMWDPFLALKYHRETIYA